MAGYKDFSVGEVLTAADVDDYLANGPFVNVTRSTTQSIPNNTTTDVSFTVETSDRSSLVAVTLTSVTVPAALAGVCLITTYAQFEANATGFRVLGIQIDGATYADHRREAMTTAAQPHCMHVCMTRLLTAGQVIKAQVFQNSGGALNIGTSTPPQLTISRIST